MRWPSSALLSLFSNDLAIDLGTANSLILLQGPGDRGQGAFHCCREPEDGPRWRPWVAQPEAMLGRAPGNIILVRPMKDGVIADFEYTERMLASFIRRAHKRSVGVRPRIVIGVPSEITPVEKRAVRDSAINAKAAEVYLVEQSMMAAIGAGLPITEPTGSMVVDIGGGTTDVAVISMAGIVCSKVVRVAGNKMDEAVSQYIKRRYNLLVGERTAEEIKIKIGSAFPFDQRANGGGQGAGPNRGRAQVHHDLRRGAPREPWPNLLRPSSRPFGTFLSRRLQNWLQTSVDRGIVLTGGGALLKRPRQLVFERRRDYRFSSRMNR